MKGKNNVSPVWNILLCVATKSFILYEMNSYITSNKKCLTHACTGFRLPLHSSFPLWIILLNGQHNTTLLLSGKPTWI